MKQTFIHDRHVAAGARMVPFGGWDMPVQYTDGIIAEHEHTRTHVSLFDCSHMGEFRITGPDVGTQLDRILPRPVSAQKLGTCRYNFLLADDGTVIDDLIVYRVAAEEYFVVVNAGTCAGDVEHMQAHLKAPVVFEDLSAETAKFDIQGPEAAEVLGEIGLESGLHPAYYHFVDCEILGIPIRISRTGYTGELGFELYFCHRHAGDVWDRLLSIGAVRPAGLGARDTLRLEMGYPLYGHELNRETTPVEAGFGEMINSDHEFLGRAALQAPRRRRLVGLRLDGRRAAREGARILDRANTCIGTVTSGSFSPSLECAVALGYVSADNDLDVGASVHVEAGRAMLTGSIETLPFYRDGTVRD